MTVGCVHGRFFLLQRRVGHRTCMAFFCFSPPAPGVSPLGAGWEKTTEEGIFAFPSASWARWAKSASFWGKPGLKVDFDNNSVDFAVWIFKQPAIHYTVYKITTANLVCPPVVLRKRILQDNAGYGQRFSKFKRGDPS